MLRFLFLLLVISGCRLETAPAASGGETGSERAADASSLTVEGPPVLAGDTARVTPDRAGRADGAGRAIAGPSGLLVPVVGIAPGDLVDTYEEARSEGRLHDAIDILAPRGTPVVAASDGRVLRLFTSDKGGLTVYQLGADGRTVAYYAHLDAYADGLAEGQRLRAGDPIGTVGDSGNAVPGNTHLHFALWRISDVTDFWDGEPINPYHALTGRP